MTPDERLNALLTAWRADVNSVPLPDLLEGLPL
jgi:hypothetical protein